MTAGDWYPTEALAAMCMLFDLIGEREIFHRDVALALSVAERFYQLWCLMSDHLPGVPQRTGSPIIVRADKGNREDIGVPTARNLLRASPPMNETVQNQGDAGQ